MKPLTGLLLVLSLSNAGLLSAASVDSATVLIVVNDATPAEPGTSALGASEYAGRYYAQARRVPLENIFHIKTRTPSDPHDAASWRISWDDFNSQIREPLRSFLQQDGLKDQIKYIVTTYGVPTHISMYKGYEDLSVDSFLASMFSPSRDQVNAPNPAFTPDPTAMPPHGLPADPLDAQLYAVTRLDGPTVELAVSLVERALRAEQGITRSSGIGYFDYRGHTSSAAGVTAEESVRQAAALCEEAGMDCQLNNREESQAGISSAQNTLWAWGSPAEGPSTGSYSFAPGAAGAQLTPDSARTIRSSDTGAWVPLWVSAGITATWGSTSDAGANLYANGDNLLNHLWSGYSFGESAYLATPSLNWKMIFLGDPLYTPVLTDSAPPRTGSSRRGDKGNSDRSSQAGENTAGSGRTHPHAADTNAMMGAVTSAGTVSVSLASGTATAGGSVTLNLTMNSGTGAAAAGVQWSFGYSTDVTSVSVTAGPAAAASGKALACNGGTCLLYGMNTSTIADGVVAIATFHIAASPSTTTVPIQVSGTVAASAEGIPIPMSGTSGTVTVTATPAPSVASVSPASGSGISQSFTFTFSDAQNSANLTGMGMLFSTSPTAFANACYLVFDGTAQRLSLRWNSGSGEDSRPVASSATLQNSQCSVGAMTLVTSGLSQVITVNVAFTPTFAGAKNIYMYASDYALGLNTGWIQKGSWTVPTVTLPQPSVDSVSPASGSGASQNFTFTFSDGQNVANLTGMQMLFSTSPATFANACFVVYDGTAQRLSLRWDSANGEDTRPVASSVPLKNSQCSVGAMTLTTSGLSQVITVNVAFTPAFAGAKNIYMYASDYALGLNTGWVQKGSWTAPTYSLPQPSVDSVSPASGSSANQIFTFTFSDAQNVANLTGMEMLFSTSSAALANACFIVYDGTAQRLSLRWDSANGEDTRPLASSVPLKNSQCSVGAMTLTTSGLSQIITVNVTFTPVFAGAKNIYMYASDYALGLNTGWVQKGSWTVPAFSLPQPSVDSVSPSGASGASQSFTFTFSDAQNAANLTGMGMLFSTSPSTFANACYLVYDGTAQRLSLRWNSGYGEDSRPVASSVTLQNSQCSVGAMTLTTSGLSQVITVNVTFTPAFNGPKNIYMYASDYALGLNTGWVQKGTWTVGP